MDPWKNGRNGAEFSPPVPIISHNLPFSRLFVAGTTSKQRNLSFRFRSVPFPLFVLFAAGLTAMTQAPYRQEHYG